MALWPAHLNQQVNHMRIVDDVNFEIQIQIQRLPGELCSGECVGGEGQQQRKQKMKTKAQKG